MTNIEHIQRMTKASREFNQFLEEARQWLLNSTKSTKSLYCFKSKSPFECFQVAYRLPRNGFYRLCNDDSLQMSDELRVGHNIVSGKKNIYSINATRFNVMRLQYTTVNCQSLVD